MINVTKEALRRMAHDLYMEDWSGNQIGRLSNNELIQAWICYHDEIPQSWIITESQNERSKQI